jgi:predicted transcriptional regulator
MTIRPIDTLLAIKVLSLAPGLNANDTRVGAALIEHFNRKTTQCDPSLDRIASLLGISTRTVIRSINRLVAAKLFRKIRHGGNLNRNRYEPVWERFDEIEKLWSLRFRNKPSAAGVSPSERQDCHLDHDSPVTQTYENNNLRKETCVKESADQGSKGFRRQPKDALSVMLGSRSADVASTEAERRWNTDLLREYRRYAITYAEILDAMNVDVIAAATKAEMRHRGAGIRYIKKALKLRNVMQTVDVGG